MWIRYEKRLKQKKILDGIRSLLELCDKEFIPPLSQRESTTQRGLNGNGEPGGALDRYFSGIRFQEALIALENGKVIGFMSFRRNYVSLEIPPSFSPNLYITTVIVHPDFRRRGITNRFYHELIERFIGYHIFTRTWSTNLSHAGILSDHKFYEYCRIKNDRGPGVDTVYYHHLPLKRTRWQVVRQYRLTGSLLFLSLLVGLTVLFLLIWLLTDGGILHELSIAFSTSLIASALCLLSETLLKYRESKNDEYINTLKSFGIENLRFHKDELLESAIPSCSHEIWISGYRLIMTSKASFREALCTACRRSRGLKVRVLTVAPWSDTFRYVYGKEPVADNYIKVLYDLCGCVQEYNTVLEVRMTEKPLFNDTYKVDSRFITSPYLHCTDPGQQKITAKDFFSLDINDPEKELFGLVEKDYTAVWDTASLQLDISSFWESFSAVDVGVLSDEEKLAHLKRYCIKREQEENTEG